MWKKDSWRRRSPQMVMTRPTSRIRNLHRLVKIRWPDAMTQLHQNHPPSPVITVQDSVIHLIWNFLRRESGSNAISTFLITLLFTTPGFYVAIRSAMTAYVRWDCLSRPG